MKRGTRQQNRRQLAIALGVYLAFTLLFLAANGLTCVDEQDGQLGILESIAGMILGFLAFPLFCIGLPLWLARHWNLEFAFWPRRKRWWLGVLIVLLYMFLTQEQSLLKILALRISPLDFVVHFLSTTLFHVSYYPLYVVMLLPVLRKNLGLAGGLVATAALFALYHLAGFCYFPAGVTVRLQALLFASFTVSLLLYLWTENLILVALAHTVGGSVGLAVNGTLFNQADELLIVTAVLMAGLFAYMIIYEIRHRERAYREGWWLQTRIDTDAG
jgi:hypothetical protein